MTLEELFTKDDGGEEHPLTNKFVGGQTQTMDPQTMDMLQSMFDPSIPKEA